MVQAQLVPVTSQDGNGFGDDLLIARRLVAILFDTSEVDGAVVARLLRIAELEIENNLAVDLPFIATEWVSR
ncbi:hypothetical protein [Bradyrhizobium diazoefficiens]